jgi:hypothetical protein
MPIFNINMDIAPLLTPLNAYMSPNTSLGLVQFGAECFHSVQNPTWIVSDYSLSIDGDSKAQKAGSSSLHSNHVRSFIIGGLGVLLSYVM